MSGLGLLSDEDQSLNAHVYTLHCDCYTYSVRNMTVELQLEAKSSSSLFA